MLWAFVVSVALAGTPAPVKSARYAAWADDSGVLHAEMKAEVAIAAAHLWPSLASYNRQHTWVPYMKTASVKRVDKSGARCDGRTNLPWPLTDRTWSVLMSTATTGAPGQRTYSARWRYVPGSGNLDDTSGSWTLAEQPNGSTVVKLQATVDLGRSVPALMLRWAERNALPQMLQSLIAQATEHPG